MPHTEIAIVIGRNTRHRRLVAGLSQQAAARHIGVTPQQARKYESGANGIPCEKLLKLAELYGCSVNDLCHGTSTPSSHNSAHPWNPFQVQAVLANFNRIRSRVLREKVCALVRAIADTEPTDLEPNL